MKTQLQAVGCTQATPIVRVAKNAPDLRHIQAGFRLILVGGDEPFLTTTCRLVLDNISSEGGFIMSGKTIVVLATLDTKGHADNGA